MEVNIIRSLRRRKTVSARLVRGALEVRAPWNLPEKELRRLVEALKGRIRRRQDRLEAERDENLESVFDRLNRRYFLGRLPPAAIAYSPAQGKRYGSCNPSSGVIRISERIAGMPGWVRDYVVVHEMSHLLEPGHGKAFRKLVDRYPLAERARGFLLAKDFEEDEPAPACPDDSRPAPGRSS